MTDIDKLFQVSPAPWSGRDYFEWKVTDAKGREVSGWALPSLIASLANALHTERQRAATLTRLRDAQAIRIRHLENRPTEDVIAALKASLTDAWKKLDAFEGRVREPDDGQPAEADCDLQHDPAHVEPGPHPSPRFSPASRPSVTDRLDAIEHRLAAIENNHNPTT